MRRFIVMTIVVAMLAVSCSTETEQTTTTTGAAPTTAQEASTTTVTTSTTVPSEPGRSGVTPRLVSAFGAFTEVPLLGDTPAYAGPETPDSVEGLFLARTYDLDAAAVESLEAQGFVVIPGEARLLHPVYQTVPYSVGEVYFVTTDAGYHYLHLAFSKLLRELEQQELLPVLESLLTGMVEEARAQRESLSGSELYDSADRVAQLFEAAATLAEVDVGEIGPLAEQEVALAVEAAQLVRSPITGLGPADPQASMQGLVDYSLFLPRGHYTRNSDLERYFRAMSLLGNENFVVGRGDTMLLGALATRALVGRPDLVEAWTLLYQPTAFLVGMADDYTPLELAEELDLLAAGWRDDPSLLNTQVAATAGEALQRLRPVGIDPEAASVRLMGARFVIDSYVYDQLRFPSVGDPPFGRRYATPLDLVAGFGSELAYRIMDEEGTLTDPATGEHWTNYDDQLAALTTMISERGTEEWAATVYDAWMYALEPVWTPLGGAYPDFMRSEAWERKDLQTGLGSYVELKHDTVLYAKQSFAAEGDFDEVDFPEPRHWVEPNPVAFGRMAEVVGLLTDGLTARGLLPADSDNAALLTALDDFLARLTRLASDELAGRPISAEDNQWLGTIGSVMEALWIRSSDRPGGEIAPMPDQDRNSAVVVDIMRTTYEILEIGTGWFDTVYVMVPADDGRFQVARGGVYSYHEFWRGADQGRLTDEEWWEMLATQPPERPAWQDPLFPGGAGSETGLAAEETCQSLDGRSYAEVVAYWVAAGMPDGMDSDGNGLPCDEIGTLFDPAFFEGSPTATGLMCRDLEPRGLDFAQAVAYWLTEGAPDRMDADGNGIPCETVYPATEVEAFLSMGG